MAEKEYEIKLVESWKFLNAQRNPVSGYRVTFSIPSLNVTDHIVITESQYTPENVKKAIKKKIELHKGLFSQ